MSSQVAISLMAGLLPVLLTWMLAALDQRGQESRRDKAISVAQKQIQLLQTYLSAQTMAATGAQTETVRQMVATETERVFKELTEELQEMDRNSRGARGKNTVQRLLLLYPMHSLAAKIARLLYLISAPIAIFMTIIVVDVVIHQESSSLAVSILTMLLVVLPFTLPTILVRWLAIALEQRGERQRAENGTE
jgi:hypothetical protein